MKHPSLNDSLNRQYTPFLLVICFFTSGLIDATSYTTWGVFANLQTGNTIMVSVRFAKGKDPTQHVHHWLKSLVAILSYCIGALFFGCLHRCFKRSHTTDNDSSGKPPASDRDNLPTYENHAKIARDTTTPERPAAPALLRRELLASFAFQTLAMLIAGALANTQLVSTRAHNHCQGSFSSGTIKNPSHRQNYLDFVPIALLAFEAAGQVCVSRILLFADFPTIVISTLYHDSMVNMLDIRDHVRFVRKCGWKAFWVKEEKQVWRVLSIVLLGGGAAAGAWLFNQRAGVDGALFVAAGIKAAICVAVLFWRSDVVE